LVNTNNEPLIINCIRCEKCEECIEKEKIQLKKKKIILKKTEANVVRVEEVANHTGLTIVMVLV
jgi:hypothetical protein